MHRTSLRLTYRLWAHTGSSDTRPSTDVERTWPRPSEGATFLTLPRHHQDGSRRLVSKGRREPPSLPSLGARGDPITISDGSGGDLLSKVARPTDEEVEASRVAKRTPWPIGLHSVEERRKKEEEERNGGGEEEEKEQWRQQEEQLEEQLEQCRQQVLLELQRQQQQWSQQLEELLEQPPRSPRQPVSPSLQGPETREEGLPVYGPPTPAWLRLGGPASIPTEPGRKNGVVAIACAMRTPADPQSEIMGSLYGIDGIAPGFLRDRRPWEDLSAEEGDDASTFGGGDANETGTWGSVDDDGRFPSLIDIFLRHGGSLETVQELIRGLKAHTEEEMENWGPGRIRL